ncbi:tyramine beta-hydroxylase [Aplysia californica]|uniref:Tyramine beta-hydroxylase n=1 Tax=Aplysia californica TaxID=6500 RepID=A0ABM0K3B8_APLCA|nr:tyramine beta-hydroxylase [Aplysia californica]
MYLTMPLARTTTTTGVLLLLAHLVTLVTVQGQNNCNVLREPGVMHMDLRLPKTEVPTDLTTYVCHSLKLPVSLTETYYAIGFEPLIRSPDIMHHMILFGCPDPVNESTPHRCGGADNQCRSFLVQWSMGIDGPICSPPDTGIRFGLNSIQSMALQIHWNNANRTSNLTDTSGVRVFFTQKPQRYDVGNVQVGQNDLEIPGGRSRVEQKGSCSSGCTKEWLKEPIYLTRGHIHMHYLGDGGVLEVVRGGKVVSEAIRDEHFDYNTPPAHYFNPPVEVRPGDEMRLTCFFNSRDGPRSRNRTVYWGEGSDGEMCYAFLTYYPKVQGFDQCIQFDRYDICSPTGFAALGECTFPGFIYSYKEGMSKEILKNCLVTKDDDTPTTNFNPTSIDLRKGTQRGKGKLCSAKCDIAIRELTDHPCMQGRLGKQARRVHLPPIPSWAQVRVTLDSQARYCRD